MNKYGPAIIIGFILGCVFMASWSCAAALPGTGNGPINANERPLNADEGPVNAATAGPMCFQLVEAPWLGREHQVGPLQQYLAVIHQVEPGDSGSLLVTTNGFNPLGMVVVSNLTGSDFYAVPRPRMAADVNLTFNNVLADVVAQVNGLPDLQNRTEPSPDPENVKAHDEMMAVINDPANKWILTIPHVVRMQPSLYDRNYTPGMTLVPAIAIMVGYEDQVKEVEKKVPPTLGGFPTEVKADHIDINGSDQYKNRKK